MKYILIFPAIVTVMLPLPTMAATVYSGCSVPALKSGHRTFFVDPVNGSLSGDGSAAKPWRTLTDVLNPANKLISTQGHAGTAYNAGTDTTLHAVNPTAPVKAGDLILLKSGDHGSPTLSNMYNTDFITVAAAPGATPIIGKMTVVSSAKWMFQGLTFQGMGSTVTGATKVSAPSGSLLTVGVGGWEGPTSDIVIDSNTFQAAASTGGWTDADWISKPYLYTIRTGAACTSITSNHLQNISNGIAVTADKSLLQGNTIEKFSNDAVNLTASNSLIKGNTIKNGLNTTADPWHPDGIQGWSLTTNGTEATNTNVIIDGNTIIKTGNPSVSYMQGIDMFAGKWNNLVIQNNVVAVNVWDAVSVYGVQNTKILNNTVIASEPAGHASWIQVHDGKDGTVSSGVTVRNNIATQFSIAKGNTVFDHNIAAKIIVTNANGAQVFTTSGNIGTANSVLPTVLSGFMTLNTTTGTFDFRLRSTSVARGFGIGTAAPPLDILGRVRTAPVDVGAYVY